MEEERKRREMEENEDFEFDFSESTTTESTSSKETAKEYVEDAAQEVQNNQETNTITSAQAEAARSHPHFGSLVHIPDEPLTAVEKFKSWIDPSSLYQTFREKWISLGLSMASRTNLIIGDINIMYPDFNIVRFLDELEEFHRYHIIADANGDIEFYKNYATEEMVQIVEHQFADREEKGNVLESYVIDVSRAEFYGVDCTDEDLTLQITFEAYHTYKILNKEGKVIEGDLRMNHARYLSLWRTCEDKPRLAAVHRITMEHII
jgi:hypothetical protein